MAREIIAQIMSYLVPVLVPAIAAYLAAMILRRVPDRRVASALTLIDYHAASIVAAIYQRTVADLKDPTKPGEWNDLTAVAAKAAAMEQLRSVGSSLASTLIACGMTPDKVESILSASIEKAVVDLNNRVDPPQTRIASTVVSLPPDAVAAPSTTALSKPPIAAPSSTDKP